MNRALGIIIGLIIILILIVIAFYIVSHINTDDKSIDIISLCSYWNNEYDCDETKYNQIGEDDSSLSKSCQDYYKVNEPKAKLLCYNLCVQNCNPFADNTGGELS